VTSPPRRAPSAALTVRWLLAIGLVVVSGAMPGTAWAYWNSAGAGAGTATVATLPPVVVTAVSPPYSDEVEIAWQEPSVPEGMAVTGYRVVRVAGGTPSPACGTSPAAPLPPTTLSCIDSGLADGAADYIVTAVVGTWTTSGTTDDPVTVAADRTAPAIRLTGAERLNALIDHRDGDTLLFFRPAAGGSIRIDAEVTDVESGPSSATFPAVSAAGWSHAAETVTSGTGSTSTVTYRSAALAFASGAGTPAALEVTGADARANAGTRLLAFVADGTPPAGGALTVNDLAADAGGSLSWDADGTFAVSVPMTFSEAESASESGLADVVLTRESAALSGGTCSSFGGASTIGLAAPVQESGLADGCYRYSLTGTDRVGNAATISTTVRVDTTAPTGGSLRANGVDADPAGRVSITASGSWSVTRADFADSGSGIVSSTLTRAQGDLTAGACAAFGSPVMLSGSPGEAGAATGCYRYLLTGLNGAGLTSELSTTVWVDRAAPTGGAMEVNGAAATGTGSSSISTSDTVTVSTLTGFTDANSGIAANEITRAYAPMEGGVCGTFDPASETPVIGTAPFAVTGLADGCHRFTLTGTDLAGNRSSVSTTVRLDASAPVAGVISVNGVEGSPSGTLAYASTNPQDVAWTKFADPESGMVSALVQRTRSTSLSNGVCGATYNSASNLSTALTPLSGTASQTLTNGRCHRYVVTGTNAFGLVSSTEVVVMVDTSAPSSSGSLRVNNTTSTSSTSATGTFSITELRAFADTQSGLASTTLTRTWAPVVANVCGAYEPTTTESLPLALPIEETGLLPGCYRYVQTGTNGVGSSSSVATVVRVDATVPVAGALTVNGVEAASSPTASQAITPYGIVRTDFTDPETTMTSSTLVRSSSPLSGGVCGSTFGSATTLTGTPSQTGLASACYRYVLTGTNALGLAASVSTIVAYDPSPSGGAFTVNGAAGTAAGSSSVIATGRNFSVTAFTGYTETQTVLASSTFTRTTGVSAAGVCGDFDSGTTVTLPGSTQAQNGLPDGCYRYVLTGVNSFGGTASVSSTVRVGP
jgi:hypothetical protein